MISKPPHLRIGDAREGCGGRDADPGHEGEQRIAQDRRDTEAAGQAAQQAVQPAIHVGDRSRFADEFTHQQEQGYDGEHEFADRFIGCRSQHGLDGAEGVDVASGHEENPERAGHAQGDGDVHADGHQGNQAYDQQDGDIGFEHGSGSLFVARQD